ncbi:hypothetical protein E6C27_scaffold1276G00040 [Cucumis melo var. makuwa]|uniref:Uncharacterized protein n=1 Tax=Cucumis melo var. makuwa TaxID=1194695 RepID=A0A5A7SRV8_CUCMM|nr:hypothetical protein E6C27_scaffold1276G00040 [Cucumis melo var. makuwa]
MHHHHLHQEGKKNPNSKAPPPPFSLAALSSRAQPSAQAFRRASVADQPESITEPIASPISSSQPHLQPDPRLPSRQLISSVIRLPQPNATTVKFRRSPRLCCLSNRSSRASRMPPATAADPISRAVPRLDPKSDPRPSLRAQRQPRPRLQLGLAAWKVHFLAVRIRLSKSPDQYVLDAPSGHRRLDSVPTGAHVARVQERASYWVEAEVRARAS